MTKQLGLLENEYRNTQGHKVNGSAQAVVDTTEIFSDIEFWDNCKSNDEIKRIGGRYYWLTNVSTAIARGVNCQVYEPGYGILNSFVMPKHCTVTN